MDIYHLSVTVVGVMLCLQMEANLFSPLLTASFAISAEDLGVSCETFPFGT